MGRQKDLRSKVIVTATSKNEQKIFSVRRLLSYAFEKYFRRGELIVESGKETPAGLALAKRIFEIEGVQYILIDQYDVYVGIGRGFDWTADRIEKSVESAILSYLGTFNIMDDAGDPKDKKKQKPET